MNSYRIAGLPHCPACNQKLDGATDVQPGQPGPHPGAFTICIYCLTVCKFTHDMGLEVASEEEVEMILPFVDRIARVREEMAKKDGENPL